jgi:hypothetical protein
MQVSSSTMPSRACALAVSSTGKECDTESGLDSFGGRYLDQRWGGLCPRIGRRDPPRCPTLTLSEFVVCRRGRRKGQVVSRWFPGLLEIMSAVLVRRKNGSCDSTLNQ